MSYHTPSPRRSSTRRTRRVERDLPQTPIVQRSLTPPGTTEVGKLAPGTEVPLAPYDGPKTRFGCAQEYQGDPNLPYYGWYAYNYNASADGCDNGSGQPVVSNTDCCDWSIIVGSPRIGSNTDRELLRDEVEKHPKKPGCAHEYNNDPNSPDFGCYHKPFYGLNAFPYDNPLFYSANNDGCPNAFGVPSFGNISCCECDTPLGTEKLGGGTGKEILPDGTVKEIIFGCAQEYQGDPNLPYYGWYAYNYDPLNPGCDNGTNFPDINNTSCCNWDILLGTPRLAGDGVSVAPRGFHHMPNGALMSDEDHLNEIIEQKKLKHNIITGFTIDTSDISENGDVRSFEISGDGEAMYSIEVYDADGNYYNFSTQTWSSTKYRTKAKKIKNKNSGSINFSNIASKLHLYTIKLHAEQTDCSSTKFTKRVEYRNLDGTINENLSRGSDIPVLTKQIYQQVARSLTLSCIAPIFGDGGEVWNGSTPSPSSSTGRGSISYTTGSSRVGGYGLTSGTKQSFTITLTAASGKSIKIDRQPRESDFLAYRNLTFGAAALPIPGEDVSGSTYYRWPVDNVAGLGAGMLLDPSSTTGGNVTVNSKISNYSTMGDYIMLEKDGCETIENKTYYNKQSFPAVYTTGPITSLSRGGAITAQAGNIIFDKQQADALKDDSNVKILAYGQNNIKSLTFGLDVRFSNLKAEILDGNIITTTTTSSTYGSASATVAVAEQDGILINHSVLSATDSRVNGKDIITSDILVTNKQAATGGGNITLASAVGLASGAALTFSSAAKIITITGDIEVLAIPDSSVVLHLDVERFLTSA